MISGTVYFGVCPTLYFPCHAMHILMLMDLLRVHLSAGDSASIANDH